MIHIFTSLLTIFFAIMLLFNLHSDFEEDDEETVSQVCWKILGPIIAIIIINLIEFAYVSAAAR